MLPPQTFAAFKKDDFALLGFCQQSAQFLAQICACLAAHTLVKIRFANDCYPVLAGVVFSALNLAALGVAPLLRLGTEAPVDSGTFILRDSGLCGVHTSIGLLLELITAMSKHKSIKKKFDKSPETYLKKLKDAPAKK